MLGKKPSRQPRSTTKIISETIVLGRPRKGAKLKEEVWTDESGEVVRYSLAYINPMLCPVDNGRVLGYDNSHEYHHRHFMGTIEPIEFDSYKALAERFQSEVNALWKEESK